MKQIPLTEEEQKLKTIFQTHTDILSRPFFQPALAELSEKCGTDLAHLLPISLDERLMENAVFGEAEDTAILRHLRYLPAMYHEHTFFEMIYVFEGTCTNYINDPPCTLKKGDLCLIAPDTLHALAAFSDEAVVYNFMIRTSTFEQVYQSFLRNANALNDFFMQALYVKRRNASLIFHTGDDASLRDFMKYTCQEYEKQEKYWPQMVNNLLHAIFILLLRRHEEDIELPGTPDLKVLDEVVDILHDIHTNFHEVTLGRLAKKFNYSERHISRLLKEQTGMNFHDIVREFRLRQAAGLLANPNLSLADIVEQVGYSDVSSFVRIFKKQYGRTPADYRKNHAFPAATVPKDPDPLSSGSRGSTS